MNTWFLLFSGQSCDGRGQPAYTTRTEDIKVAKKHYKECKVNPYSFGYVAIITDKGYTIASDNTDWSSL
jgi:hypothetical protein